MFQAIGRYYGEMIWYLADLLILPLNSTSYSEALKDYIRDLKTGYEDLMNRNGIVLGKLPSSAK